MLLRRNLPEPLAGIVQAAPLERLSFGCRSRGFRGVARLYLQ